MINPSEPPPPNKSLPPVDPSQLAEGWTGNFSREDPKAREYRLKNEEREATHKRWRASSLFAAILILCGVVVVYCLQIITNSNATADDKKWATATITLILGAGVGFVTGKAIA